MLTALSMLGGVLGRLLPEGVKLFTEHQKAKERAADRAHELEILKLQAQAAAAGHQQKMEAIGLEAETELFKAGVEATKPISGQLKTTTGVRWVDATVALLGALVDVANAGVRPLITIYWVVVLYSLVKAALYAQVAAQGAPWHAAVQALWTPLDAQVTVSIIGFWFTDRVLRHYTGK